MIAKTVSLRVKIACLILAFLSVPAASAQEARKGEPFTFTKVDLKLLEQCNLLDQRFEKEGMVYADETLNAYLDRLGKSLVPAGEAPERIQWRFRVLRDPTENAFALPNGSIYLHSGILSLVENESQIASVMAHEIAHVLNRHTYKSNRSIRKKAVAFNALGAAAGVAPVFGTAGAIVGAISSSVQEILVFTIYGYSRELEKEADLFAAERLLDSRYDPKEMVAMFRLLDRDYDIEHWGSFYNDHPKLQDRIAYINQLIENSSPRAISADEAEAGRARYLSITEKISRHDIQLNLDNRRPRTALARSQKLVHFNPNSADNLYYLGEAYRSLGPRTMEPTGEELSMEGRKKALKLKQKLTAEEEESSLLTTPVGQSAWKTNQINAEEQYRKALKLDANNAGAHRGLGMLFERAQKHQQAIEAYRRYIELRPDALDRALIQRRMEALGGSLKPQG